MRICLVYPGFPPYEALGGGISTYASVFASQLAYQGASVTVISRVECSEPKFVELPSGVKLYLLPTDDNFLSQVDNQYTYCKLGGGFYSRRVRDFIELLETREAPFDILEFGDWGGEGFHSIQVWPKKTIIRCLTPSFISEKWNPDNPPYLSEATKSMEKLTLQHARHIISDSPPLMESIEKEIGIKFSWHKIPLPVSTDGIQVKKVYSKEAFSIDNRMKIMAAGRVEKRKGFDLLITAQEVLEKREIYTTMYFAGSSTPRIGGGSSIDHYRKLNNDNLVFFGHLPRENLLEEFSSYDAFCMPSRFESFGYVGAEAMCAGLPLIASNSCGLSSYCNSETAYLFENANIDALCNAIEALYLSYSNATAIALQGQAMIRSKFLAPQVATLNLDYFQKVANQLIL